MEEMIARVKGVQYPILCPLCQGISDPGPAAVGSRVLAYRSVTCYCHWLSTLDR